MKLDRVWHELDRGPAILRGVSLSIGAGERVALMGRNGAGKSTLLRHAAGLMRPTRGKVRSAGRVALLLQNPSDYLVHDRVADEASAGALSTVGLGDSALLARHPRDLSGGEKQRLALAIVLDEEGGDLGQRLCWCAWTSPPAAWIAGARTNWPRSCASSTPPCSSRPTIPSSWPRSRSG